MPLPDEVSRLWHTMLDLFSVQTINPHLPALKKYQTPCETFVSFKPPLCFLLKVEDDYCWLAYEEITSSYTDAFS